MASPPAAPHHVVVKFLVQASQQPCVCFVAHVPGGARHETRGVYLLLAAATGGDELDLFVWNVLMD
jgi:hypothetical protein